MKICFYAAVRDPSLFELVEFYRQDVTLLRSLGHDVRTVRSPFTSLSGDDLLWVWWPTSGCPPLVQAALRRIPSVLVTAISDRDRTASGMAVKPVWTRLAARLSFAIATTTLATSDDTRLGLDRYRIRAMSTAPLGVDTDFYSPGPAEPKANLALTVSHLTPDNVSRKRLIDVVRIAAATASEAPDLQFLIVGGEGGGGDAVRAEIARLGVGDRVTLAGRVEANEKRALMRRAKIYLQPTQYEAFGLAVAEAMACGTPVLSNAVGNMPELLGRTGALAAPNASPEVMGAAMLDLLQGEDLEDLGERARQRILSTYSLDRRRADIERALDYALAG